MSRHIMAGVVIALALATGAAATEVRATSRGLDLTQSSDARAMLKRLDTAAITACGASGVSVADAKRAARKSDCYSLALRAAVRDLNAPTVTGLYRGESQRFASR